MIRAFNNCEIELEIVEEFFLKWVKYIFRLLDFVYFLSFSRCWKNCMWEDRGFFRVVRGFFLRGSGRSGGSVFFIKCWDNFVGSFFCLFDKIYLELFISVNVFLEFVGFWFDNVGSIFGFEIESNRRIIFL